VDDEEVQDELIPPLLRFQCHCCRCSISWMTRRCRMTSPSVVVPAISMMRNRRASCTSAPIFAVDACSLPNALLLPPPQCWMVLLRPELGTFTKAEAAARADEEASGGGNHGGGGCVLRSALEHMKRKRHTDETHLCCDVFAGWRVGVHIAYSLSSHSFCIVYLHRPLKSYP
jgi:hypothetical protein